VKPVAKPVVLAALLGVIIGIISYHGWITFSGSTIDGADTLSAQASRIAELEAENQELSEDLFRAPAINIPALDPDDPPYSDTADAVADVTEARERAIREAKFLMITFGANWCVDCRTLYQNLKTDKVRDYAGERFVFTNVNVGKFNRNTEFATTLGVSLERGIPVAVFFDPDGNVIGTTNNGELEPARLYTSNQILKFVRDVVERSRILAPDAVQ
jgi:thioredoxin-related protein